MNSSSKRYLVILGPLVCLAIVILGITEYWHRNSSLDEQISSQAQFIANRLEPHLQTAIISEDKALIRKILALEFEGSDLNSLLIWTPKHERLLYGVHYVDDALNHIEVAPERDDLPAASFVILGHQSDHTKPVGILDIFVDMGAFKKRHHQAAISTALKTSAVAFPLMLLAICILYRQEKVQVEALRKSIIQSNSKEHTHRQNILEGTEAGTWDLNIQTSELILNERWAEIIGYTLEELQPIKLSTWEKAVHPQDLQKAQILIEQHLSGSLKYYDTEFRQRHKDGSWRWINARGKIVKWTADGVPLRMSGTHLDITERKMAEEASEATRQLLQTVFDAASGFSVIATDPQGIITLFNSGAERMLGYTTDEMVGHTTPLIFHIESELEERGILLKAPQEATPDGYMEHFLKVGQDNPEWTYVRKDGKKISVKLSITTTHDESGAVTGYLGAAMDISDRKHAEFELNESRQMLQKVLDTIPVRVFWKDENSVYLGANQRFADDAGIASAQELIGQTDYDFIWTEQAQAFREDDATVIQSGQPKLNFEEQQGRPDGSINWVKTSKIPLRNEANQVIGVLGTYEDITLIKQAQEDLIEAKEAAEAASKAKDEFLAVMSHEMRTPLNPILGFADLLRQNITTTPEAQYIETIINAGNRQLRLIDDILEYMRINNGQVEPVPEPFNLTELCQLAVSDAQSFAGPLKLSFVGDPNDQTSSAGVTVKSDLLMLRRILDNLLNNACKYTHEGSIAVSLGRLSIENGGFFIAVKDTGIGIDAQNQQQLFDAFSQADSSYTRKHEGLGLGLAICKKILTILGGTITVESEIGIGSTFTIHLPLKELAETPIKTDVATQTSAQQLLKRPSKVLIVDDQSDNRLIARSMIESFGGHAIEVTNGKEAVEQCHLHKFEVILMDLAMPVMDGYEATKQIRNITNINQATPIIAVTADVTPKVQDACIAVGMQSYISKPVDAQKIFDLISAST